MKQDLLAKGLLLPTLSTSTTLQDIYFFLFLVDLVCVLTTTKNTSTVAGYMPV